MTDPADRRADIDLVLGLYAAYARRDLDAGLVHLHPDVEWIEPPEFPNGGPRRGRESVGEYLRLSLEGWSDDLTVEPTAHLVGNDIAIVVRHHGVRADGSPADLTVADVFTVEGGLVVRMKAYADPTEPLRDTST